MGSRALSSYPLLLLDALPLLWMCTVMGQVFFDVVKRDGREKLLLVLWVEDAHYHCTLN